MPHRVEALINPAMLAWARQVAHMSTQEAAKKIAVPPEKLEAWEKDEGRPTIRQARLLAHYYHQPFAAFYLPKPPEIRYPEMKDYRRLPGTSFETAPPDMALEVREAMERREIILELYREEGDEPLLFNEVASIQENPERVGARVRNFLHVRYEDQIKFRNSRLAFNAWRESVENAGILVFQATHLDVSLVRGFSLGETPLPVIVVNRKDSPAARCFTLLHELVHIMLHAAGLCDLEEAGSRLPEMQQTEIFCNQAAAAALVPRELLLNEDIVGRCKGRPRWDEPELKELATRYGVSREVILRRLLTFDLTNKAFYEARRRAYLEEYHPKPEGFAPPPVAVVSAIGKPFVRRVLDAYFSNRITSNDVADYLGIRLKHLSRVIQLVSMPAPPP